MGPERLMQLRRMSTPSISEYFPLSMFKVSALFHLRMFFLCIDVVVNFRQPAKVQTRRNSLGQTNVEQELQSPTSAFSKCAQNEHFEIFKPFTALEQFVLHIFD